MKIFDCTTFYSEHLMMDVRFNILNENVDKFVVVESKFSHSGKEKQLNFNINNYPKFKDKIIYLTIDHEPEGIINEDKKENKSSIKRINSLKRIELSYNYMLKGIETASNDDLIILSDNDEIPNLESNKFINSKKKLIIFKQLFFYYKFNLLYDAMFWYGSKACKKKDLISMSWLRNLKNKKYPLWRFDTLFSNTKYSNLEIIEDGGWHFTNLKKPEELYEKMKNFGHHNEFDDSGLTVSDLKKKINNHELFYNHFTDQKNENKWKSNYKLKKTNLDILPKFIQENRLKLNDWIIE
tara:strand:+ start:253 stop:1140 length:888 start_codon:yes stop_codon:yes gene_type:complete